MSRWLNFLAMAGLIVVCCVAGCSSEEKLPTVKGTVTVGSQPLTAGSVVLHPNSDKGNKSKHEPRGDVGPDGQFTVTTNPTISGVAPGWYKVTVYSGVRSKPDDPYSPEKFLANKKYLDKDTSKLEFEVKQDAPAGAYDLKLDK